MNRVKKAVILAAGLGTRFLPITKTFPKEILPLIDKPVLQYLIEEAVNSGIKDIVFVLSPEKKIIKEYFRKNKKLEYFLKKRGQIKFLQVVKKIDRLAHFTYVYQKKPLGIGDAILCAQRAVGDEPFALFFADDVIESKTPCLKQMLKVYQQYQAAILAISRVSFPEVRHYGIVKIKKIKQRIYRVLDLIEKPSLQEAPSNFAIVGRYILEPEIFKILRKMEKPKEEKELYLTDALKILLQKRLVYAYEHEGQWLSCGHKFDWLKANIEVGLKHPEVKKNLKKYLYSK